MATVCQELQTCLVHGFSPVLYRAFSVFALAPHLEQLWRCVLGLHLAEAMKGLRLRLEKRIDY